MENESLIRWIREFRLANYLDNYEVNEKLLEIERVIKNIDEWDNDRCLYCSFDGNEFNNEDISNATEEGYENGMNETLDAIRTYVERRLNK